MTQITHANAMQLTDRLSRLLRDEIAAIGQGNLARVESLYPRKTELLAEIEKVFADPEHLLAGDGAQAQRLRARLEALNELIHSDLTLLQRMTEATGAVAREIERIRERHSLEGLYDRDGTTGKDPVAGITRLDQSI
ncbi:hypothetical protein ATO6_20365 [Oceanicola sp. 22II-s10i]|uniref:hypothetical protein n=1 Tax=Oceanicola sp. 22II-s10i TaxID=1317116 RepID=UPI000B528A73|nr:hypothetical protein [Oceanicola sp. 22II-s10i]OWU83196.1 hypothetical protein ATO6_20365 [Oceanicola sp. 22II-s10i]